MKTTAKITVVLGLLVLSLGGLAQAGTPIIVDNNSFEYDCDGNEVTCHVGHWMTPGSMCDGSIAGWRYLPQNGGWVGVDVNCGTEDEECWSCHDWIEYPDGTANLYFQGNTSVHQILDHDIAYGLKYTMTVDLMAWDPIVLEFFSPNDVCTPDVNHFLLSTTTINPDVWQDMCSVPAGRWMYERDVKVECVITDEALTGRKLGIKIGGEYLIGGDDTSYLWADNVRLEYEWASNAYDPDPPDGAEDVNYLGVTLSWLPGLWAVNDVNGHEVYFGTSWADVNSATTAATGIYRGTGVGVVSGPDGNNRYSYDVLETLELGKSYFWRIDEVNDDYVGPVPKPWKGDIWSFTTARVLYVDALNGDDDNDGLSPQTPFATIQKAIDSALDGDTVLVADGTYTGDGNRDIDFRGKAITVRSESGPQNCVIDCNAGRWNRHRGFYFHSGEQENSVLDGFTITNAYHYDEGGAISCRESSPTITNCIITGNSADIGGGIYLRQKSHPTITNCTITENQGGGIACMFSSPVIVNCTIAENQIVGIACIYGSSVIINCNIAENKGPGIAVQDNSLTVANCTITGNTSERSGGGVDSYNSELTIANSTITGNSAAWGGGVCVYRAVRNIITNCTISGNTAKGMEGEYAYGGGIIFIQCWDWDEPFTLSNCTISGNIAKRGGGICNFDDSGLTVTNCTISGNTAETGGAICNYDSVLTVTNCILWGDSATYGPEIAIVGGWDLSLSIAYSDVQDGQNDIYIGEDCTLDWGPGNINADPCFVEPGYRDTNGVWVDGDYHLLPDSLCIDTGDPNYIPEPNETDLDGNPRVIGGRIDMGAYESNYIQAAMKLTPQMLNCNSRGKYAKAHFVLPEGFLPEDVDVNAPAVAEPMGIESEYIKVIGNDDGPVRLEIAFDRQAFCETITETGEIEITVIGSLTTSRYFYATDTIKIKPRR